MASFIPAYVQTRLLRYALVKIDLFESDELDKLLVDANVGWKRTNTIQLRNVQLKVDVSTLYAPWKPSCLLMRHPESRCEA